MSGKDLPGFCLRCWTRHLTDGDKLAVLSPYHRAGAWGRIRPEDEPEVRKAWEGPPEVPGEPVPIWSTGWTLWTYDPEGKPDTLEAVLCRLERRWAEEAVTDLARRRLVAGVDVRNEGVMYGDRARGDENRDADPDANAA